MYAVAWHRLWYISYEDFVMSLVAKLFTNGRSQAVRLPAES
jgi:hypothetical protein